MSALIDDLTESMTTLLASGSGILASTLRRVLAKVIAAIAVLEARARGNRIFYTKGIPADALGMEGDLGVNKDNGDFFEFTGGTFVFLFNAKPGTGGGGGGAVISPVMGSYTVQQPGEQAIAVANAVVYLVVGVVDQKSGSLKPLAYGSGYTYTSSQLTILAAAGVQPGEVISYQYLVGNATGGSNYSLPTASSSVLGGVKVGSRLTMTNGFVNVPVASDTVAGVVRIDTNTLQINNGVLSVNTSSGNISPAATPTNVRATIDPANTTACTVAWDAMQGATLYQVYRQVNGGPWGQIAIIPYPNYYDTSGVVQNGTFVLYRVTSANSAGQSPASNVAQAT